MGVQRPTRQRSTRCRTCASRRSQRHGHANRNWPQGRAELDENEHAKDAKVFDAQSAAVNRSRHAFHGAWNYRISPTRQKRNGLYGRGLERRNVESGLTIEPTSALGSSTALLWRCPVAPGGATVLPRRMDDRLLGISFKKPLSRCGAELIRKTLNVSPSKTDVRRQFGHQHGG
jgi:hypothetical protein